MNDNKWFGYDNIHKRPYIYSYKLYERFHTCNARLTDINLSTNFRQSGPFTLEKDSVQQYLSDSKPGIHMISLRIGDKENASEKTFCFFQPHIVDNKGYNVRICIKNNRNEEKRTKIMIESSENISEGLLFYTLPDCLIQFEFPEILKKTFHYYLIQTPACKPDFKIKSFKVPENAEVYPEGTKFMDYGIKLELTEIN